MTIRSEVLSLSVPALQAVRWSIDHLYAGMKETYAIARVESGRLEWRVRGKVFRSEPGSLLLQQPGDVHRDLSRDGPATFQLVAFPGATIEDAVGRSSIQPSLAAHDERGAAFQRLHDAVRAGAERLALEVAVAEAISALARLGGAEHGHTPPVRRAMELLRERLTDSVHLDALAAHAGVDKYRLCRAFRTQVGMPPHAYLTRLRITRAKELLAAGKRPSEIARQVGFYDQSQLNRHFRRIVGTTPARYVRWGDDQRPFPTDASGHFRLVRKSITA
ncbi:MAG: helix-turn-helix transcriptional regulator [Polyangiaceae bacterium]|nr:helix-turn-helix transcriptional regulator [Polyangiaceae bacterium]